jgi:hypothetical protein
MVVQGGFWHCGTNAESNSNNNIWEAGYLTNVFEPTKDKTYSIKIEAIARSFGENGNIDSTYIEPGLGYRGLFEKMQNAYKDGLITADDCYFVSMYGESLNDYYKFFIQKGNEFKNQGLLIDTLSLKIVIDLINLKEPEKAESFIKNNIENKSFDNVIIIPCSPLIIPTKKK